MFISSFWGNKFRECPLHCFCAVKIVNIFLSTRVKFVVWASSWDTTQYTFLKKIQMVDHVPLKCAHPYPYSLKFIKVWTNVRCMHGYQLPISIMVWKNLISKLRYQSNIHIWWVHHDASIFVCMSELLLGFTPILNHIDTRTAFPRDEDFGMVHRPRMPSKTKVSSNACTLLVSKNVKSSWQMPEWYYENDDIRPSQVCTIGPNDKVQQFALCSKHCMISFQIAKAGQLRTNQDSQTLWTIESFQGHFCKAVQEILGGCTVYYVWEPRAFMTPPKNPLVYDRLYV